MSQTKIITRMKNLINYQDHSSRINEEMESPYDKYSKEDSQEEFDHFNKLVVPKMKAAGFKRVIEPVPAGSPSYGSGYFCFPDHSTGVNLFLSTSYTKPWKYVVFQNGNKDLKEFQWKVGTDSEVTKCANDAVAYAVSLKEKMK